METERDNASEMERGGGREREIQRREGGESERSSLCVSCVCVRERERDQERGGEGERGRQRERQSERRKETEGRGRRSEREEHLEYLANAAGCLSTLGLSCTVSPRFSCPRCLSRLLSRVSL